MPGGHKVAAYVVISVFMVGWVWGLGAAVFRREPGERFWTWVVVEQVVAATQAILGVELLIAGFRPDTSLHYVYGIGPLVILGVAHLMSREVSGGRAAGGAWSQPWVIFSAAAFICFGLSLRALMTGLGIG